MEPRSSTPTLSPAAAARSVGPGFHSGPSRGTVAPVQALSPALGPGVVLAGRFCLLRRLGAGGLAEVWAAADAQTGGEVAVKLLHAHLCADAALVERFERELAIARSLSHPRLVRVFDLHRHEGRPFFSMELLRGQSLAERLDREGRPPREEALRLARQIAEGLAQAHDAGVVHRDLKPHNVFLCEDPAAGPAQVKLLDFGLARAAGFARLTAASTVMGTPGYMAPEVLLGSAADPRADLYALGAVLFELLCGRRAFSPLDVAGALALKAEAPPSPREVDPAVDGRDDAIVRRLLEPDPERRFLDARQVLRALDGGDVPLPPEVPPPLVRGEFEVVVLKRLYQRTGPRLSRVLQTLGAEPGWGWRLKYALTGAGVLVTGASRASAEAVVRICAREGLAARVRPARREGRALRWLRDRGIRGPAVVPLAFSVLLVAASAWLAAVHPDPSDLVVRLAANPTAFTSALLTHMFAHPFVYGRAAAFLRAVGAMFTLFVSLALPLSFLTVAVELVEPPPLGREGLRRPAGGPPGAVRKPRAPRSVVLAALVATAALGALHTLSSWLLLASGELHQADWDRLVVWLGGWTFLRDTALVFATAWLALRSATRRPHPGAALPAGDPALVRMAASVRKRLEALRARCEQAPPADRLVLASLLEVAEQAGGEAARLVERTSATAGEPAERDRLAGRLLRVGAALDDALAVAGAGAAAPAAAAGERLRLALAALDERAPTLVPLAALAPAGATPVEGVSPGRTADRARSA